MVLWLLIVQNVVASLCLRKQALAAHLHDGIDVVRIAKGSCVSKPSIFLSDKELAYLDSSSCGILP